MSLNRASNDSVESNEQPSQQAQPLENTENRNFTASAPSDMLTQQDTQNETAETQDKPSEQNSDSKSEAVTSPSDSESEDESTFEPISEDELQSLGYSAGSLQAAAYAGDLETVKRLLEQKANIDSQCKNGDTPLHAAFQGKKTKIIMHLIENKADFSLLNNNNDTPIHIFQRQNEADKADRLKVLKILLEAKISLESLDEDGNTVLHIAAKQWDNANVIQFLLEEKANVNALNKNQESPLYIAAKHGEAEVCVLLLNEGANASLQTPQGHTPLLAAKEQGHSKVVEVLNKWFEKYPHDSYSASPIHVAAMTGDLTTVKRLLTKTNINSQYSNGDTPLHAASKATHDDIIQYLAEQKADITLVNSKGDTAMQIYEREYEEEKTATLQRLKTSIETVGKVNEVGHDGDSALHLIVTQRFNVELAQLLLEGKANINLLNKNQETPLYIAAKHGEAKLCDLLLKNRADPSLKTCQGDTPLKAAQREGHSTVVNILTHWLKKREESIQMTER